MLRIDLGAMTLTAGERFGLDILLDLSRILRFEGEGDVVRLRPIDGAIPAIGTWHDEHWGIRWADGEVLVTRGALALAAQIAGAAAEQQSSERDRFQRVPSNENALVAAGLEREPIVSHAAKALCRAVLAAAGERQVRMIAPWPDRKRWAAAFSHDLDVVTSWPVFTALRLLELLSKQEFTRATKVGLAAARHLFGNPVLKGVAEVLSAERQSGVRSTWFVLCGTPTLATMRAGDLTYRPESKEARRILEALTSQGLEIGLHGSFETYANDSRFRAQRERLALLTGRQANGVRQHYLRMQPGATQHAMATAGFGYDSTYGFADRNGFRLGAADVIPAWNSVDQIVEPLEEVPFVWMDRALSKYQGVESPDQWVQDALQLAGTCREVEGLWTGIWHPNLTPPLGFPDAPAAFNQLVRSIASTNPFLAPIQEIVAWRRARRTVRGIGIRPDGSIAFRVPMPAAYPIVLEDRSGNVREERAVSS